MFDGCHFEYSAPWNMMIIMNPKTKNQIPIHMIRSSNNAFLSPASAKYRPSSKSAKIPCKKLAPDLCLPNWHRYGRRPNNQNPTLMNNPKNMKHILTRPVWVLNN
jgi:hypothetical protein